MYFMELFPSTAEVIYHVQSVSQLVELSMNIIIG